ncbi:heparinase II/III family protein [Amaricoccus macauensis]|uniref:heparinase II/III family protein n=1 Tax=Amaricoccus macauensis TaxID=57001 RepID=UPI003C7A6F49
MSLTIKALRERLARPRRRWGNRMAARRANLGATPDVAEMLPEPVLFGDADRGMALVGGTWQALGHEIALGEKTIWAARLPDARLEPARQSFGWLDDLGALGNKAARTRAQNWLLDWIKRYGAGLGPGWTPECAGLRAQQWTAHAALLAKGLEPKHEDRFWRALAGQQRYLTQTWQQADAGLPRLRALAGLVWSGIILPHRGHRVAMAELGQLAETLIDGSGEVASRRPEDLAEALILLIWTARVLENAGQHAPPAHLSAIVRGVPVLRPLRMGDATFARFHGGSQGDPDRLDQALAELRIGVQAKPPLSMGFCRLTGGRTAVVLDAAVPPAGPHAHHAHASTLAFEMSVSRQPLVVNCGPGEPFGPSWHLASRQTAFHSTVEVGGQSSAWIRSGGIVSGTFGARLTEGPLLVSVRQAQDATGQWLLATHDGYSASRGVIHERRIFVDARGAEIRGEDILTVPDARARSQFDKSSYGRPTTYAARFHLHPDLRVDHDTVRQLVLMLLPTGEAWVFRSTGGEISLEDSTYFDPRTAQPIATFQIVVNGEIKDYLGQAVWSFKRLKEAPRETPAEPDNAFPET